MTDWLRRAGRGRLPDGSDVAWSLAEGNRGRRWRWTIIDHGRLRHSGLVETDATGRFARLELSSPIGLLVLHPEPDRRSIHGNVVSPDGVRPVAHAWSTTAGLTIAGDAFGSAILPPSIDDASLVIRPRLGVVSGRGSPALDRDERGVPILDDAAEWPLED